jgi:hypothetical protein
VKGLLFLMLMIAGHLAAGAETLTSLQKPAALTGYSTGHCVGLTFGVNDSVDGYCSYYTTTGGGGRGSNYTYTYTVFAATWDNAADLTSSAQCGTAVKAGVLPIKWTYQPGYDASNCQLPPTKAPTDVLRVGPNGYEQWYGYFTTSTDGAFELLLNGETGTLGAF